MSDAVRLPRAEVEVATSPKWIRVFFGGEMIASSKRTRLKRGRPITYFFPREDVKTEYLAEAGGGKTTTWTVQVGDAVAERAAWSHEDDPHLAGHIAFKWHEMDAWFEEDEEIHVHPRDPYVRLDTVRSSRHVRVVIDGETVAETRRPVLLFETGLATRYYIPKVDVRMDLLVPSDTHTGCPYKGQASYYSVKVGQALAEDVVWYYPFPEPEVAKIQGLLCFYQEKVDEFYVDGEQWSD